jgi:GWxTD domain-containing protein
LVNEHDVTLLTALLAGTALIAGAPNWEPQQEGSAVEIVTRRSLRGEATLVDGFCRVPLGFLTAAGTAGGQQGSYRLAISVMDSEGTVLHESGWSQSVSGETMTIPGASTVEHFALSVLEGRYTLAVSITDSVSGRARRATAKVEGLPSDTRASDLILSSDIRRAEAEGAVLGPGEIQKGALLITASTRPVLTPRRSELFYYVELYPGEDATVELRAMVVAADGSTVTSAAPQEIPVGAAGGVAARSLSLTGLPEGEYRMQVTVRFAEEEVTREAEFTMKGFETEAQIARVVERPASDMFAQLTEARLDSLHGPTVYLQESGERGVYEDLSVVGKQNYLRTFWERRDPTPGTNANEYRDAYYALFAEANRRFRESGAGDIPGWRTDRGRIFLKRGEPEDFLRRPVSGNTLPYEVWKYSRPRLLKYVFLDVTGLGSYQLIYTDDRFEPSRADWQEQLGPQAVEDVLRF